MAQTSVKENNIVGSVAGWFKKTFGPKYWDSMKQETKRTAKRSAASEDRGLEENILKLHSQGLSTVEIAIRTGAPCSVVIETVKENASKDNA